jgi:hypothetical protein
MTDGVVIALIGAGVSVLSLLATSFVAIRIAKISRTQDVIHKQINGQQEALLSLTAKSSKAEGKLEEKSEEKERNNNLSK